jgi:branched-chain amino acid transport system substrate-binding protein
MEAAGAEILVPVIVSQASIPFVKEWYDRQSPCVVWGILGLAEQSNFWELTEGKCECVSFNSVPVLCGYPLTNQTVPTREAYQERWGTAIPSSSAVAAYDGIRFILPDAITRAGTIETEAVIKALETIDVETSMARHFIFTRSHDLFVGAAGPNKPEEDYVLVAHFQWQNGTQVPVKPEAIMKEAGATYKYPPWDGPWSK